MKIKILLILLLQAMTLKMTAQISFIKHFGQSTGKGNCVILNSNNNYVVGGLKLTSPALSQFCIWEIDQYGDTIWSKKFGTDSLEEANKIIQTIDGGYAVIGYSAGPFSIFNEIYFVKTNSVGVQTWAKHIGGPGHEQATSIIQLGSGEYLISGRSDFMTNGQFDFYLINTTVNGDTIWTKNYGGLENEEAYDMINTSDGGYILCGYTESFTNGMKDCFIVKTDNIGDTTWTKHYGGANDDLAFSVYQTTDGGFITAGYMQTLGPIPLDQDVYVVKTDQFGDTLWTRKYGQPGRSSWGKDIMQTTDGGFIITGSISTSFPTGGDDVYIIKTDIDGNVQWEKEFKIEPTNLSYTSSYGNSIVQTSDGGYAITGNWFNAQTQELLLIKTLSDGTVGISEVSNHEDIKIFPNPFDKFVYFDFYQDFQSEFSLEIINGEGKVVKMFDAINSNHIRIERADLPSGMYFYRIQSTTGLRTGKILIQ